MSGILFNIDPGRHSQHVRQRDAKTCIKMAELTMANICDILTLDHAGWECRIDESNDRNPTHGRRKRLAGMASAFENRRIGRDWP
jgi:hypothetical protein